MADDEKFSVVLTREEITFVLAGLNMRRNFIETGDPCMGSEAFGPDSDPTIGKARLRPLSTDQMRLIVKQEDLAKRLLTLTNNPRR